MIKFGIPAHLKHNQIEPMSEDGTFAPVGSYWIDPILDECYQAAGDGLFEGINRNLTENKNLNLVPTLIPKAQDFKDLIRLGEIHKKIDGEVNASLRGLGVTSISPEGECEGLTWPMLSLAWFSVAPVVGMVELEAFVQKQIVDHGAKLPDDSDLDAYIISRLEKKGVIFTREVEPDTAEIIVSSKFLSTVLLEEVEKNVLNRIKDLSKKKDKVFNEIAKEAEDFLEGLPPGPEKPLCQAQPCLSYRLEGDLLCLMHREQINKDSEPLEEPVQEEAPPKPPPFTEEEIAVFLGRVGEFRITDEESASWLVGKVRENQMKIADLKNQSTSMVRERERKIDGLMWKFGGQLGDYCRANKESRGKYKKFLDGEVYFSKTGGLECTDDKALQAWVDSLSDDELALMGDLIEIKRVPDKTKIKQAILLELIESPPGFTDTPVNEYGEMGIRASKKVQPKKGKNAEESNEDNDQDDEDAA